MILVEYGNFRVGFSSGTGALVLLTRTDSPYKNLISTECGDNSYVCSLDLRVEEIWLTKSFKPVLKKISDDPFIDGSREGRRVTLEIELGDIIFFENYLIERDTISRSVAVTRVGGKGKGRIKITGLKFVLPCIRIGNPYETFLLSPGSAVKPNYPLLRAIKKSIQVDEGENLLENGVATRVISDDFPVSSERFGFVIEPSPDASQGILAVTNTGSGWTLLSWYVSRIENAIPGFFGSGSFGDSISLVHTVNLAGWLEPGESFEVGTQYILVTGGGWENALEVYRSMYRLTGISPPVYGDSPEWVKSAVIYEVHPGMFGGFKGLRNELNRIRGLGFNTLYLLPIWAYDNLTGLPWDENWTKSGSPYAIRDFELFDRSLGTEEDFADLISEAHRLGMKVLLDFVSQGCSKSARYVAEKPNWFVRDENGRCVSSHGWNDTYSFDWANEEFHSYMLKWSLELFKRFRFDGYRVDAPVGKEPNWDAGLAYRASKTNLGVVSLLEKLRVRLREVDREAILLCEVPGPIFMRSHDMLCDYLPLSWTVRLVFGDITSMEWGAWMRDYWLSLPPGANRVSFMETHDTRTLSPPSYGLRGSAFEKAGFAALVLAGFIPMVWAGQEVGSESFYRKLFSVRANCQALIGGGIFFNAVKCSNSRVLSIIRVGKGETVWGLISLNPEKQSFIFDLPVSKFSIRHEKNYRLYDLLDSEYWVEYGKSIWRGDECGRIELSPLPYKPYFLVFREVANFDR